jgi:DNA invertase Pin-like site-specific DNA recombinase
MATVGYVRVSSVGQSLDVQLEKLKGCDKVFKQQRSGVDTGGPALKQYPEFLRDGGHFVGDEDRPPRSLNLRPEKGVSFKALDDPSIDARSRTGKLVMGILALIAEFENDTRREWQMDGIAKAKDWGVKFGRKRELTSDKVKEIRTLRVGLLCNGSHTLSFSKVPPGPQMGPITPIASDGTHYADWFSAR